MAKQSYRDLEIVKLSMKLAIEVDKMTKELPRYEQYEEGSQIRRSAKSIAANIVEGYGRKKYKNEFVKFLIYANASCDETKIHLQFLHECGSLGKDDFDYFIKEYSKLGRKISKFIDSVIEGRTT